MKLSNIILSWDFVVSIVGALVVATILPDMIETEFSASFYMVGITVLSIIFSLFFAALAILMSSTDNDFIIYLEEKKQFTRLMASFKFTLALLFASLIYSIILYVVSDYDIKKSHIPKEQSKWFFCGFVFLFSYGLLATAFSIKDTISFTHFRTKFLHEREKRKNGGTNGH
jgi:hypothetical protein